MALHQDVPQKQLELLRQRLGQHVRHIILGGDEVDGNLAVLYQLTNELHSHIEVLHLVIRLERLEYHARKRVTSRMCRIFSIRMVRRRGKVVLDALTRREMQVRKLLGSSSGKLAHSDKNVGTRAVSNKTECACVRQKRLILWVRLCYSKINSRAHQDGLT